MPEAPKSCTVEISPNQFSDDEEENKQCDMGTDYDPPSREDYLPEMSDSILKLMEKEMGLSFTVDNQKMKEIATATIE